MYKSNIIQAVTGRTVQNKIYLIHKRIQSGCFIIHAGNPVSCADHSVSRQKSRSDTNQKKAHTQNTCLCKDLQIDVVRVQVIIQAKVQGLCEAVYPVKVKVKYGLTACRTVSSIWSRASSASFHIFSLFVVEVSLPSSKKRSMIS